MHTWTADGRITLGTGAADGAELWAALDLTDQLAAITGGGVHTLLWDRVITGWAIDYVMARHRIQTVNKSVARSTTAKAPLFEPRWVTPTAINTMARSNGAQATTNTINEHTFARLRRDVIKGLHTSNDPLPVGTCIYESKVAGRFEVERSKFFPIDDHTHQGPHGPCTHRLTVDGGGLYVVQTNPEQGHDEKIARVLCRTSRTHPGPTGWVRVSTWVVHCEHGPSELTLTWTPPVTRYQPDDTATKRPASAMAELRPVSRGTEEFGRQRHRVLQQLVQKHPAPLRPGRVTEPRPQELDFLTAALVNNSITSSRHKKRLAAERRPK